MFNDRMPKDMESLVYNAAAEAKLYLVLKIIFLVTLTSTNVTVRDGLVHGKVPNTRQGAQGAMEGSKPDLRILYTKNLSKNGV